MAITALSFADYHALEAWGSSSLKAMRRGPPARVLWERANPMEDTDDTRRGSAVHSLFITPDEFLGTHAHKPDGMSFATKEGKAWRAAQGGLRILSHDEWTLVEAIVEALRAKRAVADSLAGASMREMSMTATLEGEPVKARPDWIDGEDYITDLKVSRHADRPTTLAYHASAEGWMHQVALYGAVARANGRRVAGGRLAVVAPTAPHYVYCLEVKRNALDLLTLENAATLRQMGECRRRNEWPGTPDAWTPVEPPIFDNESDVSALVGAEEVSDGA